MCGKSGRTILTSNLPLPVRVNRSEDGVIGFPNELIALRDGDLVGLLDIG